MTTRTMLIDRLLHLPQALRAAEEALLKATILYAEEKLALECREADLLILGVEGGNAEVRKARLHVGTLAAQDALRDAAEEKERAALAVRCLNVELRTLEACGRLLGGPGEALPRATEGETE